MPSNYRAANPSFIRQPCLLVHIRTQTGQDVWMIESLQGGLLFFLALTWCFGQLESKLLYQDLAQRQNIKP